MCYTWTKSLIPRSAAEYLTFITATGEGGIEAIYADENVWLTQKMMGVLYGVDVRTVNYHLKKILLLKFLDGWSSIRFSWVPKKKVYDFLVRVFNKNLLWGPIPEG